MGSTLWGSTSLSAPHWGYTLGTFTIELKDKCSIFGAPHPHGLLVGGFHIFINSTLGAPHWGLSQWNSLIMTFRNGEGGSTLETFAIKIETNVPNWSRNILMGPTLGGSTSLSAPYWGLHIGDFHNGTHWKRNFILGSPHPYGLHIGGSTSLSAPHWGSTFGTSDTYVQDNC